MAFGEGFLESRRVNAEKLSSDDALLERYRARQAVALPDAVSAFLIQSRDVLVRSEIPTTFFESPAGKRGLQLDAEGWLILGFGIVSVHAELLAPSPHGGSRFFSSPNHRSQYPAERSQIRGLPLVRGNYADSDRWFLTDGGVLYTHRTAYDADHSWQPLEWLVERLLRNMGLPFNQQTTDASGSCAIRACQLAAASLWASLKTEQPA